MEVWKSIDESNDPFLDNISLPLSDREKLEEIADGFSSRFINNPLLGVVAAGDGVVFRMITPTNDEVDDNVIAFYTRKGYYAYGLQAFCDHKCRFVNISSVIVSSSFDNTAYNASQLAKDIAAGKLHPEYYVIMDQAYTCSEQELSPWRGTKLSDDKDAFNFYLSQHRQRIERTFGMFVQRWGLFWRPLRLSFENRG